MSHRPLAAAAAAVAVLTITLLSACSWPGDPASRKSVVEPRPVVGMCWTVTVPEMKITGSWQGEPAVPCTAPHQAYTFAIAHLDGITTDSWDGSSDGFLIDPVIESAATHACQAEQKSAGVETPDLAYPIFYLPSEDRWARGDRWVRCDYSQVKIGSAVYAPGLVDLPASFAGYMNAVRLNFGAYAWCIDEPGSTSATGPFTQPHSYYADCSGTAQWRYVASGDLPQKAFPNPAEMRAYLEPRCGGRFDTARLKADFVPPTKDRWDSGDHLWMCWRTTRATR